MGSIKRTLEPAISWVVGFLVEITAEIRNHNIKLVAGSIFIGLVFIVAPLWIEVQRAWANWNNITPDRALAFSRQIIGARVQIAIPFKNVGNPNQLIAAWVTKDATRPDPCIVADDTLDAVEDEQECPWGYGTAQAILLIGNDEIYQEYPTRNYAFNITAPPPEIGGEFTFADYQKYFGVTDWNGDGKMEMLSIAAEASPSRSIGTYLVTLFDTGSLTSVQLRVTSNRNRTTEELNPPEADNEIRPWLNDRWKELMENYASEACNRNLTGELTCNSFAEETDFLISEETERVSELAHKLHQKWIENNGSTFVIGNIRLNFLPGEVIETEQNGYCEIEDGDLSFVNAFKGPLFVVDKENKRSSALYVMDGTHLREIPNIVVGEEYVWLSLAQGGNLIAIKKSSYEAVSVAVAEWARGIPSSATGDDETVTDIDEASKQDAGTAWAGASAKDIPIEIVMLKGENLSLNGKTLSLIVDGKRIDNAAEFRDAQECYYPE
ncbi:hypothetical protein GOD17_29690 [Sinorhizobium medicae]|uniref:hypothetical protein n=1 Tax=Rhizobium meliloti TaxID=382 RepID=UPI0002E851FA|nr:hypothetical protein [Sinorhizobium meliloti]MDE4604735.1 hypothetical protein [Sinorhizobium meliloti]MDW9830376.1 hypothetical protein [Sinorhizobium meliloti]MDX0599300.1 hypothetical protein [Sinorhizobium medicae]UDU21799.1 hypothetical protein LJD24_24365 [Sinorhizobium meliloti]